MHVFNVIIESNDPPVEMLVAELAPGQSLEELFEAIYKTSEIDVRRRATAIAVRPPVKWPVDPAILNRAMEARGAGDWASPYKFLTEALTNHTTAFARVAGKPIHILASHEYQLYLSRNVNPAAVASPIGPDGTPSQAAIDAIRDAEIDLIVDTGRAKLPSLQGVLYRAPSGRLMKSFLRVGNIQRSRAVLDALFFWLIPQLHDCIGLVTDTWSISSISMNASRRLSVYAGGGAPPCPVEMLSQYHDGSPARTAEAAEIIERLIARARAIRPATHGGHDASRVVFLISATHTGSLAQSLHKALQERAISPGAIHFVALFKVGPSNAPVVALRDLSAGPGSEDFAIVDQTDDARIETIPIDEQVYFPLQYRDVRYVVRQAVTLQTRELLERYRGVDLIRVHRTVQHDSPPRHQAVWIDTVALVNSPRFRDRLIDHLRRLEPVPDLIVTPRHEAAQLLGRIALEVLSPLNNKVRHIEHSNLLVTTPPKPGDIEVAAAIDAIDQQGAILILDDAFITGTRLSEYSTHMRNRTFAGRIHYLVALARPADLAAWELRRRILAFRPSPDRAQPLPRHTVDAIETIVLPDWHEAECPWCREIALYRNREATTGAPIADPNLQARLITLIESRRDGLQSGLFVDTPGLPPLEVTRGSLFVEAPADQATVFAAVAAALQRLRTPERGQDMHPLGPRHFPVSTVLDDSEYFGDTFTDGVLRAAFLRAARTEELVFADANFEQQRADRARALVLSETATKANVAAELVVAMAFGKLPRLVVDESLSARLNALGIASIAAALT